MNRKSIITEMVYLSFFVIFLYLISNAYKIASNYAVQHWNAPTLLVQCGALALIIALIYGTWKIFLPSLISTVPGVARRGRPLKINDPPVEIPRKSFSKSKIDLLADSGNSNREGVEFITERITIIPMAQASSMGNSCVISDGDESDQRSRSGLFEIHVFFSVHNWSHKIMNLYDIHARLYHVSAGYAPARIGYVSRYRVELYSDNSILTSGKVFSAEHGSAVYIELVFETGFYDDTGTTLAVFGLDVDFELSSPEGVSKWRIPSDKIYTLQHWGPPYGHGSKVHVQDMNAEYISAGYEREKGKFHAMPDTAAAQTLDYAVWYECLGNVFTQHISKGLHRLN